MSSSLVRENNWFDESGSFDFFAGFFFDFSVTKFLTMTDSF